MILPVSAGPLGSFWLPVAILLLAALGGVLGRRALFARLRRLAASTASPLDDLLVEAAYRPFLLWCLILGAEFALELAAFPDAFTAHARQALFVLGVISFAGFLAGAAGRMLRGTAWGAGGAGPGLIAHLVRFSIYAIALLVILATFGVSVTPVLATLGVGGLAVALALQDTLTNLFAGFYITVSRQLRIGDYVKLETGQEGYITDITWRATRIRALANNTILVPNQRLAAAIVTNYWLPDRELAVLVQVGVHYDSDLEQVERETVAVAREAQQSVPGAVAGFEPFIRYHTFADSSVNFTVILRAREFVDQHLLKHEFVKRLHARYRAAGIVIPYPIRAINVSQERRP